MLIATLAFGQDVKPWQQRADYKIEVTLNDTLHTLDGVVTIAYTNYSPDTLRSLWMHLWPNAYKNDKTAYSEQSLQLGEPDFYFSKPGERGYINRLDVRVNGISQRMADHPQYIDVIEVKLQQPLLPGKSLTLSTPFHVQLPYLFSRSGHMVQSYAVAQWFPKIAMYDEDGWHPMTYLELGEYYSNFGNYEVAITLPTNYVVGATGMLQDESEKEWMRKRTAPPPAVTKPVKKGAPPPKKPKDQQFPASAIAQKTVVYKAENVIDFAWFADKRFLIKYDTVQLVSRTIEVWNLVLPNQAGNWKNSIQYTKNAIRFYSRSISDYPYPQVTVVQSPASEEDGMEYPMITYLNSVSGMLPALIAHEVGHNWFQAVLATNERDHPWMDEGMNSYFEQKFRKEFVPFAKRSFPASKLPNRIEDALLNLLITNRQDPPIASPSEAFGMATFNTIPYTKTAQWLEKMEADLGTSTMDSIMKSYYSKWKFAHPGPYNFKRVAEEVSGKNLSAHFNMLRQQGPVTPPAAKRKTAVTGLFNFRDTESKKYLSLFPALGYNLYDGFQIGLGIHNYNIPAQKLQFVATPMLGTRSGKVTGYGRLGYPWYPKKGAVGKAEVFAGLSHFSYDDGTDIDDQTIQASFTKAVPGFTLHLRNKDFTSTMRRWVDFRTWVVNEQQFLLLPKPAPNDTAYYATIDGSATTIIPQLTMGWANDRYLNPWSITANLQQVKDIVRLQATLNYFLQFNKQGDGISARLFAGKIFYTTDRTDAVRSANSRYHFTMYGPNGQEDYTYSNAFAERNQSTSIFGRQIMIRDGGFKYRSDYSAVKPGLDPEKLDYFDNWMLTANFTVDVPQKFSPLSIIPIRIPLKVFTDVGTSASPWNSKSDMPNFLYSIGLQIRLFKALDIYYPLFQSKDFEEPNSVNNPAGPNWWQKRLTFSFNIDKNKLKLAGVPLLP